MKFFELGLLIATYTILVITVFVSWICYKRHLEKKETVIFLISLLVLITTITFASLVYTDTDITHISTLLAILWVAVTTPLDVLAGRQHTIPLYWKKILYISAASLAIATIGGYYGDFLYYLQYIDMAFLVVSICASMLLVANSQPYKPFAYREKTEQLFAKIIVIVIPILLIVQYTWSGSEELRIGFLLPLLFMGLAAHKLADDLQRLALFNPQINPHIRHFDNYALSEREREIALLLAEGKTYNHIAEQLHISLPTVKTHASNIYKKCGVKTRAELIALLIN